MNEFALSSAFIPNDRMEVHVWVGASGKFEWYEDDGTTEKYRDGEFGTTPLEWDETTQTLRIHASHGHWDGRPASRDWAVAIHGLSERPAALVDGKSVETSWDASNHILTLSVPHLPTTSDAEVHLKPEE